MTENSVRAVVFDIDGTLLTTGGAGAKAWARAFHDEFGVDADIEDYTEGGMPDHDVCKSTFEGVMGRTPTEREIATLIPTYVGHLWDTIEESDAYRVMPGVPELLLRLRSLGLLLGITTGNVESAAHIKLSRGQLNHHFTFGGYGSDSPDRGVLTRTAIERGQRMLGSPLLPEHVIVVGDTPRDVAAARFANAIAVAVATGHFTVEQLAVTSPDHVLATLEHDFPI